MKCPHCVVEVHADFTDEFVSASNRKGCGRYWYTSFMICPACGESILRIYANPGGKPEIQPFVAYPFATGRPPVPKEVPAHIAEDYLEACAVIAPSPKASAALSRRCLQSVLRENGFAQKDLAPAIQAALDSKALNATLAENLDAIRNIGNFAAHPMKDTLTGQILPVEPHEAEWNLDVLEDLFDFFYVQPEKSKQRRAALDMKLAQAGKPAMK